MQATLLEANIPEIMLEEWRREPLPLNLIRYQVKIQLPPQCCAMTRPSLCR